MPSYRHSWEPISCVFPQTLISSCVCLGWAATHHFTRRMKHAFSPRSWRQNMRSTRPTGTKSLSQVGRKHLFWWSVITATCRPSAALQHRHYSNMGPFLNCEHCPYLKNIYLWIIVVCPDFCSEGLYQAHAGEEPYKTLHNWTSARSSMVRNTSENLRKHLICGLKITTKYELTYWIMKKPELAEPKRNILIHD